MTRAEAGRAPWLGRVACCAVVFAVALTLTIGVRHWLAEGDPVMAAAVFVMEIIAALAPPMMLLQWRVGCHMRAAFAAGIGLLSALFCTSTTWMALHAEASTRAASAIESSEVFQNAASDVARTTALLDTTLNDTGPTCSCPATIRAWQTAHGERVRQLTELRTTAQERLGALAPSSTPNIHDIGRPVVLEAVKLLGLIAFGWAPKGSPSARAQHAGRLRQRLLGAAVGAIGLGAQSSQAHKAPSAYERTSHAPNDAAAEVERHLDHNAVRHAKIEEARALLAAGMPKTAIARELGVCRNTVGNWLGPNDGRRPRRQS